MRKVDNRGSAAVELSLIMPVILLIIVLIIKLYLGLIGEGKSSGESYRSLYLYEIGTSKEAIKESDGNISLTVVLEDESTTYETEYDKCSSRLRRWQLYGDVIH